MATGQGLTIYSVAAGLWNLFSKSWKVPQSLGVLGTNPRTRQGNSGLGAERSERPVSWFQAGFVPFSQLYSGAQFPTYKFLPY